MKNFKNTIDEIYEFVDELLGSFIPGVYFCSYFIFTLYAFWFICIYTYSSYRPNTKILIFLFCVISYVIGTMFRRSNSREPDMESAQYIYYDSAAVDDNDYAFAELVTNEKYDKIIKLFNNFIENYDMKINYDAKLICNRQYKGPFKGRIKNLFRKAEKKKKFYRSKPYVLKHIYLALVNRLSELDETSIDQIEEINNIKLFIRKSGIEKYSNICVEYPYGNLKKYLKERGFTNLAQYVDWENIDDNKITKRSKSFVWDKKLYIKHFSSSDYGHLQKIEAHIRFMNAMWHANKRLLRISGLSTFVFGLSSIFSYIIKKYSIIKKLNESTLHIGAIKKTVQFFTSMINYFLDKTFIQGKDEMQHRIMLAMLISAIISLFFFLFGVIIKNTIINNYHYQRIREIVSILMVYEIIKKEQTVKKQNNETLQKTKKRKKYKL